MDLDRIKRNVAKMASQNAPIEDIDGYIASEGATVDQIKAHKPQAQTATEQPQISFGDAALDVAKSGGIGLAQGAIGLATLPGNLEYLGRLGIDKAATTLGFEDPKTSSDTVLPTFGDVKSGVESVTGKFYEPKTTAGEYARTIGEFAPMAALGPGAMGMRAANVVAPALASETAGQLTKGTAAEPWARAAGALAGGMVPTAAMRTITPVSGGEAVRAAHVANLKNEGVTALTAGQRTGNKALRWAETVAADTPGAARTAERINTAGAEQFTRAALRRAGVNADRATPDVIDGAFQHLGQRFNAIAAQSHMRVDSALVHNLRQAVFDYEDLVPPSQRAPFLANLVDDIRAARNQAGAISGEAYQATRSRIETLRRSTKNDPNLANALRNVREALDDAMGRSVPQNLANEWRNVRGQYRNLIAIEKAADGAGEAGAVGLISPAKLRQATKTMDKRSVSRGRDDLGNLARSGDAVMKPLPNSGTAPRQAMNDLFAAGGAAGGALFGGAPGAAVGAVAAPLVRGAVARGVLSGPVQNYLSNQALSGLIDAYQGQAPNALMRLPQAASDIERSRALTGGIGPRYDENGRLITR